MLDFDINRALILNQNIFAPFLVQHTTPLQTEFHRGRVSSTTALFVLDQPSRQMALLTEQMNYHHVAQGEIDGNPWMATT